MLSRSHLFMEAVANLITVTSTPLSSSVLSQCSHLPTMLERNWAIFRRERNLQIFSEDDSEVRLLLITDPLCPSDIDSKRAPEPAESGCFDGQQ